MDEEVREPLLVDAPAAKRPSAAKQASSACKCCLWISLAVVLAFVGCIAFFAGKAIVDVAKENLSPHSAQRYNASNSTSLPVVPIVGHDQLFDIAVTVWIKPTEPEILARRTARLAKLSAESEALGYSDSFTSSFERELAEEDALYADEEDLILYSEVPPSFRNLRLSDQHVVSIVEFEVPTARFCGLNLSSDDLRATFVLLPSSPSLLDNAFNYSSYIPPSFKTEPARAWPFPLGSEFQGERTMQDMIADLTSDSAPLVRFLNVPTEDAGAGKKNETSAELASGGKEDDDEDLEALEAAKKAQEKLDRQSKRWGSRTFPPTKPPLLVSRTQLRVHDDVTEYDLAAFNARHNKLKATSCRQHDPKRKDNLAHNNCESSWRETGPFATRVQFISPAAPETTRRGYMPFLTSHPGSHGLLDLIPIPVNRSLAMNETEEGVYEALPYDECILNASLPVSWRISFSGRSPAKLWLGDTVGNVFNSEVAHNASDLARINAHSWTEELQGLAGHRFHDDAHPRRRFFLNIVQIPLRFTISILTLLYWIYVPNRLGLVVWAAILSSVVSIASSLVNEGYAMYKDTDGSAWIVSLLALPFIIGSQSVDLAELWACRSWNVKREGRFGIKILRRHESHWERANGKLERQTPRVYWLALMLSIFLLYFFLDPAAFHLRPSSLPPRGPDDLGLFSLRFQTWHNAVVMALVLSCNIAQLHHNHRSRTFAGQSRMTAYLAWVSMLLRTALTLKSVVGEWKAYPGHSVEDLMQLGMASMWAWQALTLKAPESLEREVE
ncbi:hypothetical protein BCR35DRAFT_352196 [Leucosporidium creatinivorum]|uniref:Uncharacterized protein n=1 Tax=Leucosporidium creatinivorum TaxID=106004 RepID=A0A1Y2FGD8_9BASI|nr:hypothetical protein BCR35DRAFT_352196 [Leucosporidium creatinivorum]